jgi:hypothetical protein
MADDPVRVKFTTTEEDLFRYILHNRLHNHPLRILLWGYYPIFIYGGASIAYGLVHGQALPVVLILTALGGIFAGVLYPLAFRWIVRRTAKRFARENLDAVGERTFECSPERVSWTWTSGESTQKWTAFQRIVGTPEYVYLYFGRHRAFIVPRRAFASPEAAESFLQKAIDWHRAATAQV